MVNINVPMICKSCVPYPRSTSSSNCFQVLLFWTVVCLHCVSLDLLIFLFLNNTHNAIYFSLIHYYSSFLIKFLGKSVSFYLSLLVCTWMYTGELFSVFFVFVLFHLVIFTDHQLNHLTPIPCLKKTQNNFTFNWHLEYSHNHFMKNILVVAYHSYHHVIYYMSLIAFFIVITST